MPRYDGSGPRGKGEMTGKGLGRCLGSRRFRRNAKVAAGLGLGLGFAGRKMANRRQASSLEEIANEKEILEEKKQVLQAQVDAINFELENLE